MDNPAAHTLAELFAEHFKEKVAEIAPISPHASSRVLMRLKSAQRTVVGVSCENVKENRAFVGFSRHFRKCSLPVPEIYCVSKDEICYLQEDLGEQTLFDILIGERESSGKISQRVRDLYAETVRQLSYFQVEASKELDYSLCVESLCYDDAAMLFDCNRFTKELVERMGIVYQSEKLQADFSALIKFLSKADASYFLYRDFQGRNVMIRDNKPFFIDYQGGRHGALQYDLASLLYQSQARLPEEMRESLIDTYLAQLSLRVKINRDQFIELFDGFVLIRLIQVLGAYGQLGLGEKRDYFLKGIPFAVSTFLEVLSRQRIPLRFPEMTGLFGRITQQLE